MADTAPTTRRRWFQLSLAEWLILMSLVGVIWGQSAAWPVIREEVKTSSWQMWGFHSSSRQAVIVKQRPSAQVIALRGFLGSAVTVVLWWLGSRLLRLAQSLLLVLLLPYAAMLNYLICSHYARPTPEPISLLKLENSLAERTGFAIASAHDFTLAIALTLAWLLVVAVILLVRRVRHRAVAIVATSK
jgi:hypothetical protein